MRPNQKLAGMAEGHHGVFTGAMARGAGLSKRQIEHRLAMGEWTRVHEAVYRLAGTPVTPDLLEAAAVLAAGSSGCLSHLSAAARHGLIPRPQLIDVFAGHCEGPQPDGVRVHRCRTPVKLDVVMIDRIPCTSVRRTLLDVADRYSGRLRTIADRVVRDGVVDREELEELCKQSRGHHGVRPLRHRLAIQPHGIAKHDSDGETAFEEIAAKYWTGCWKHHMMVSTADGHFEADFAFPQARLVVEVDGRGHLLPEQRAYDAYRDSLFQSAGWRVLRIPRSHVLYERGKVVAQVTRALKPGTWVAPATYGVA